MAHHRKWGNFLLFYTLLAIVIYLVAPLKDDVKADTQFVNDSAIALLNISNRAPRVVDLVVDDSVGAPANEIDLVSASVTKVSCNGTVIDGNGINDIIAVNATLFFTGNTSTDPDDRNEHYTNSSCTQSNPTLFNATYTCTFSVWFFANNGTWYCNMSAYDLAEGNPGGVSAHNSTIDSALMGDLLALDVPPVIDYGELTLNESSPSDVIENVTNTGNMDLDLQLYGYGGTTATENNYSMICDLGTINVTAERFSTTSGVAYESMTQLSGQAANPNSLGSFDLPQRLHETLNSTKNTYWKIGVPLSGVKGLCNGTVVFLATPDS
jgi:hypothetical protein